MDIYEKIENGDYRTMLPQSYEKRKPHDDMTIREARELEASERANEKEYSERRRADVCRLENIFHADLAAEYNLTDHPKEPLLFEIANHREDNFREIAEFYEELSALLR